MSAGGPSSSRVEDHPLVRVVLYYLLLLAAAALLWRLVPEVRVVFAAHRLSELSRATGADVLSAPAPGWATSLPLVLEAGLSIAGTVLLMLPVTWVYILTRQKKGFRQSVVQTLIVLPVVVCGVVLIVRSSVALAFSLAGIVAAVSFRNTLRDTKDAVYIFLALGVGLAAGVQALSVAAVLSVLFNLVVILLWWTDFGRMPAALEGPAAARRLEQARRLANRSGAFISQVDRELLKSMTPEQLGALAGRLRTRQRRAVEEFDQPRKPLAAVLRVRTTDPDAARRRVEEVLEGLAKAWEFSRRLEDKGRPVLEYRLRLRKSVTAEVLAESLRAHGGGLVAGVDIG